MGDPGLGLAQLMGEHLGGGDAVFFGEKDSWQVWRSLLNYMFSFCEFW